MEVYTDIVREVVAKEGSYLTVKPCGEVPGLVSLSSIGEYNEEWFGKIEISMAPQFARQLGNALIKCADEVEET